MAAVNEQLHPENVITMFLEYLHTFSYDKGKEFVVSVWTLYDLGLC